MSVLLKLILHVQFRAQSQLQLLQTSAEDGGAFVFVCPSGAYRPVMAESGEYVYCPPQRWLNNLHVSHMTGVEGAD